MLSLFTLESHCALHLGNNRYETCTSLSIIIIMTYTFIAVKSIENIPQVFFTFLFKDEVLIFFNTNSNEICF